MNVSSSTKHPPIFPPMASIRGTRSKCSARMKFVSDERKRKSFYEAIEDMEDSRRPQVLQGRRIWMTLLRACSRPHHDRVPFAVNLETVFLPSSSIELRCRQPSRLAMKKSKRRRKLRTRRTIERSNNSMSLKNPSQSTNQKYLLPSSFRPSTTMYRRLCGAMLLVTCQEPSFRLKQVATTCICPMLALDRIEY
jgi:hypothetical protein